MRGCWQKLNIRVFFFARADAQCRAIPPKNPTTVSLYTQLQTAKLRPQVFSLGFLR